MNRSRRHYLKFRERYLQYSFIRNTHVHRPGKVMPREILVMVRLQCLQDGGDPGRPLDLQRAAHKIGEEFDWLGRGWLHPDSLTVLSKSWAQKWRNFAHIREHSLKFLAPEGYAETDENTTE